MADSDVFAIGQDLLAEVESRFATAAVGLPDRRYVHAGEWALDCAQLVVAFENLAMGVPGRASTDPALQVAVVSAQFEVSLVRCVPSLNTAGSAPSAAALTESAEEILTDAWVLQRGLLRGLREGTVGGGCGAVVLGSLTPIGPRGGFGGVRLPVIVDLA